MKQKINYLNRYTASALVFLVMAAVTAVVLLQHNRTEAAASSKPGSAATVRSKFSTTGTEGWRQGPTRKTDMALFQNDHNCFVSVQYHAGTVDIASELQKLPVSQAGTVGSGSAGATLPMTLQTNMGEQKYDLHQYTLTSGNGSDPLMRGLQLGYLQLSNGYVKFEGHCNESDQLPSTVPALQSVKFDADH